MTKIRQGKIERMYFLTNLSDSQVSEETDSQEQRAWREESLERLGL
jgi:hypothetical protein